MAGSDLVDADRPRTSRALMETIIITDVMLKLPATRLCAVFGSPIRHSASPAMHNAAFAALGLDWRS